MLGRMPSNQHSVSLRAPVPQPCLLLQPSACTLSIQASLAPAVLLNGSRWQQRIYNQTGANCTSLAMNRCTLCCHQARGDVILGLRWLSPTCTSVSARCGERANSKELGEVGSSLQNVPPCLGHQPQTHWVLEKGLFCCLLFATAARKPFSDCL